MISAYSTASATQFAHEVSTDGMGFARDAVVNVIPVKDTSGRNALLLDLKAGDFLLATGEQSTLVVAGSAPGVQPSP